MAPNPRCTLRELVVLTAALIALTAMACGQAAAATSKIAAATRPTTQSTTRPVTSPGTSADANPSAPAAEPVNERADWTRTMNRLATLLAGKELRPLQKLLQPSPVIRPFGSDALQTHDRLLGATTGSTVIGVHAYDKPPTTLATDLANDFHDAGDVVPQGIREGMLPTDEAAARRGNETAAQWLVQVLQPEKHEVTGVIILWPQTRGRLASAPNRATFVLVKGEQVDGLYVLRQITFGDPLESPQ